ncbi:hypothetical protein [Helicoverpa armigera nucleopolyhedrovirus]|nr:hypothetical protein [Helicoverpa armigera nucleopolyhedrovirus]
MSYYSLYPQLPAHVVYRILAYVPVDKLLELQLSEYDYKCILQCRNITCFSLLKICYSTRLLLNTLIDIHGIDHDFRHSYLVDGHKFYLINNKTFVSYTGLRRYFTKHSIRKCYQSNANVSFTCLFDIIAIRFPKQFEWHKKCCFTSCGGGGGKLRNFACVSINIVDQLKNEFVCEPAFLFFDYMYHVLRLD